MKEEPEYKDWKFAVNENDIVYRVIQSNLNEVGMDYVTTGFLDNVNINSTLHFHWRKATAIEIAKWKVNEESRSRDR